LNGGTPGSTPSLLRELCLRAAGRTDLTETREPHRQLMTEHSHQNWVPQTLESDLIRLVAGAAEEPLEAWRQLIDRVRPARGADGDAELRWRAILSVLQQRDELRYAWSQALGQVLAQRHAVLLFATSGIYPNTGLLAETSRRLTQKLLPEAEEPTQLKSTLGLLLRASDERWIAALSPELWLMLVRTMAPTSEAAAAGWRRLSNDLQESIRVVAHRIAAAGLETEFLRLEPTLEQHASPFMALCDEVLDFLKVLDPQSPEHASAQERYRHILILADQCRSTIEKVRRRAQRDGASFILTFRIRRLNQHLDRLQGLLDFQCPWDGSSAFEQRCAGLLRELLLAECGRNQLRSFWRQNSELVALRVAENAGRSGEHYITSTREQYMAMLRAAAGGGFVVAWMAVIKMVTSEAQLAPLTEILANCLNYGIGFVLIHLLNFAVATKQPAMTANAIAAALDAPSTAEPDTPDGRRRFSALIELVARTVRTQLAAVCGNIAVALPTAVAIASVIWWWTGRHFVSPEKAEGVLQGLQPFGSAALAYAAVAGVCLFVAGLIAGFYDNLCAYSRIPQRLLQLRWPTRLLGSHRMQRLAGYIENNLGALAGNFSLGFLLGGASGLGSLLAWPLDVRHVTLTSANWGFAMTSLNVQADGATAALAALGVGLIGAINLLVSFSLAMWIALRSRGIASGQARRVATDLMRAMRRHPRSFFLPPPAVKCQTPRAEPPP
jgi:site-specific recombinase